MKTFNHSLIAALAVCGSQAWSQEVTFTNLIRQVQSSGTERDVPVDATGQRESELAIDPGGGRFELWTISSNGPTSYLLSSSFVGTYIPVVQMNLYTEDTTSVVRRTRADRPFFLDFSVTGLRNGETDPIPSKSIKFLRHVQAYPEDGDDSNIDKTQAILFDQSMISANGPQSLTFALTSIPGADRTKVRGEERFSFYSLEDYQAPESQIMSQTVQVWPIADGSISGIVQDSLIRLALPQLTITLNDLYPSSTTYAQVYKGNPVLGTTGTIVTGSAVVVSDSVPQDRVLILSNYGEVFDEDGRWTMELVTVTPFGVDRLSYVSFDLDRTIKIKGSFTTIE